MENYNSFFQILESKEKKEFEILFEDKTTWYNTNQRNEQDWRKSQHKINAFDDSLKNFINLQNDDYDENICDLSYIRFPPINITGFFNGIYIEKMLQLYSTTFYGYAYFSGYFKHNLYLASATFYDNVIFDHAIIEGLLDLSNTKIIKHISMNDVSVFKIDFKNIDFKNISFFNVTGYKNNKIPISSNNFINKESARIIKSHFEKQGNIIESNKYFSIEQEKYIEYLWNKNSLEYNKKAILTTLYLNKISSNFGNDWVRSLFLLFLTSHIFMIIYMYLDNILGLLENGKEIKHFNDLKHISYVGYMLLAWLFAYISTFYHKENKKKYLSIWICWLLSIILAYFWGKGEILSINNYIVQLVNPINAFKDMDLYKGVEFYAVIVRVTILTIIYQLVVAFRQNTRRG